MRSGVAAWSFCRLLERLSSALPPVVACTSANFGRLVGLCRRTACWMLLSRGVYLLLWVCWLSVPGYLTECCWYASLRVFFFNINAIFWILVLMICACAHHAPWSCSPPIRGTQMHGTKQYRVGAWRGTREWCTHARVHSVDAKRWWRGRRSQGPSGRPARRCHLAHTLRKSGHAGPRPKPTRP